MNTNPGAYVLGPEEGEAFWAFGALCTPKATAEQTGGRFSVNEEVAPRGEGTPLHVHREDDETFYVLEGELTFYLNDDRPIAASAGSFVHVPGLSCPEFPRRPLSNNPEGRWRESRTYGQ